MEKESKKRKTDFIANSLNKFFSWEDKRREKKFLRKQRFEEKFGKYRLIKNERIRAIVQLVLYIIFFITLFIIYR